MSQDPSQIPQTPQSTPTFVPIRPTPTLTPSQLTEPNSQSQSATSHPSSDNCQPPVNNLSPIQHDHPFIKTSPTNPVDSLTRRSIRSIDRSIDRSSILDPRSSILDPRLIRSSISNSTQQRQQTNQLPPNKIYNFYAEWLVKDSRTVKI